MAASSKLMITEAERRFPCRIKVGVPIGGLGSRLTEIHAWLDANCGADGWAMTFAPVIRAARRSVMGKSAVADPATIRRGIGIA